MEAKKQQEYEEILLEERKRIKETIKDLEEEFDEPVTEASGELSSYDNHPADIGTEVFMRQHDMSLNANQKNILTKIDLALRSIDAESYGNCIVCGKVISEERLDILPYAITCKKHNENIDRVIDMSDVSEEEYLDKVLMRINTDDVEVDEPNIVQKLMKFNRTKDDPSNSTGDLKGVFDEKKGSVEDIEKVSEGFYEGQKTGEHREDIPDDQKK